MPALPEAVDSAYIVLSFVTAVGLKVEADRERMAIPGAGGWLCSLPHRRRWMREVQSPRNPEGSTQYLLVRDIRGTERRIDVVIGSKEVES